MNPSGKSAGGGSKGGRSKGKACGDDVVKRSYALQTSRAHMLTLRKALQTDEGRDRDVTQAFAAFKTFSRNGLDASLQFAPGGKLEKAQLRAAKQLVDRHGKARPHYAPRARRGVCCALPPDAHFSPPPSLTPPPSHRRRSARAA